MKTIQQALDEMNPKGFWLIHGDEPLVAAWLVDAWRIAWQAAGVERKRVDGKSAKSWLEALGEFDALSLFASETAVELHISHKPDKKALAMLAEFAQNPQDNCLVALMPSQDWRAQKSKLFDVARKHGAVIDTTITNDKQRQNLLNVQAKKLGLILDAQSWQLLLSQTQNNLLAAFQALWRASDLVNSQIDSPIGLSVGELEAALVSQSRYSVYDLQDAVLHGDMSQTLRILSYLKQSKEAPTVVLWTLAADARKILGLMTGASARELGIWSNKYALYEAAARRLNFARAQTWSDLTLNIDCSIKGLSDVPVWHEIGVLALSMAGYSAASLNINALTT